MTRPLYEVAAEIKRDWARPYFGAVPYIEALEELDSIEDMFYEDTARYVVAYFLGNAQSWRGETARRVKTELKLLLKEKR